MTEENGQAGDLTRAVAALLLPYVKSWGGAEPSGDSEFDALFNAEGVADFAARKLVQLLSAPEALATLRRAAFQGAEGQQ